MSKLIPVVFEYLPDLALACTYGTGEPFWTLNQDGSVKPWGVSDRHVYFDEIPISVHVPLFENRTSAFLRADEVITRVRHMMSAKILAHMAQLYRGVDQNLDGMFFGLEPCVTTFAETNGWTFEKVIYLGYTKRRDGIDTPTKLDPFVYGTPRVFDTSLV